MPGSTDLIATAAQKISNTLPAVAGTIWGGIQAISSGRQLKLDKNELNRLSPVFYKIQDEYLNNENQANEMAQGGLAADSKDYYGDLTSRGLSSGASSVLQAGGNANQIAQLFSGYNDSIRSLGAADSEQHLNNIKYFQQVSKDLAGQKTQQWAINEYIPHQNKLKELTDRIAADKQNINNGISTAIGSFQAMNTGNQNSSLLNNLFKSGNNQGSTVNSLPVDHGNTLNLDDPFRLTSAQGHDNTPAPNATNLSSDDIQQIMDILNKR